MNLFKILANGEKDLREEHVSAFLAYLLDPAADHGLGRAFLTRFLGALKSDDSSGGDEREEAVEYVVKLEQEFHDEPTQSRPIVDIVLVGYQPAGSRGGRKYVAGFISQAKQVSEVVAIEVKVRGASITSGQLLKQFKATSALVKSGSDSGEANSRDINVLSVYVPPDVDAASKEFARFQAAQGNAANHFLWKNDATSASDETSKPTIYGMLLGLLDDEATGKVDPINEHTRHTLKAFAQYIYTNFTSAIEDARGQRTGSYTDRCRQRHQELGTQRKLRLLRERLLQEEAGLNSSSMTIHDRPACDPRLIIQRNGLALRLWAGYAAPGGVNLAFGVGEGERGRDRFLAFAAQFEVDILAARSPSGAHIKPADMGRMTTFAQQDEIVERVRRALERMDAFRPADGDVSAA